MGQNQLDRLNVIQYYINAFNNKVIESEDYKIAASFMNMINIYFDKLQYQITEDKIFSIETNKGFTLKLFNETVDISKIDEYFMKYVKVINITNIMMELKKNNE